MQFTHMSISMLGRLVCLNKFMNVGQEYIFCMCMCVCVNVNVCVRVCVNVYVCVCVSVFMCMCVCVCVLITSCLCRSCALRSIWRFWGTQRTFSSPSPPSARMGVFTLGSSAAPMSRAATRSVASQVF